MKNLLVQIDPRTYRAQLDQAQATLEHDQAHLKNAQPPASGSK
jgi:multidrug efflux system membrane fusion protein